MVAAVVDRCCLGKVTRVERKLERVLGWRARRKEEEKEEEREESGEEEVEKDMEEVEWGEEEASLIRCACG
jgi:hypothetical protein